MLQMQLLFLNIGTPELILILLVVVLFFGPRKIPEIARGIAKGLREMNSKAEEIENSDRNKKNNSSDFNL